MNTLTRQYLFGLIFSGFGIYKAYTHDFLEFTLYALAGIAFIFNALALEPKLMTYRRPLAITTWVLIVATGIMFIYLLQFKFFG